MSSRLPPHMFVSANGHYRYRRTVPEALRKIIGVREVKRALGKDYTEAMKRYAAVHKETESLLAGCGRPMTERDQVLSALKRAGVGPDQVRLLIDGDVSEELSEALAVAWSGLVDDYEEATREGRSPEVSLEAIRAIGAERLPPQTYTIDGALSFYLKHKETGDEVKDKQLATRLDALKKRLVSALSKEVVFKRGVEKLSRADANKVRDFLLGLGLNPNSVRRELNNLCAALTLTIREHDLTCRNPFDALVIKGEGHDGESRYPLTEEDMKGLQGTMETEDDLGALWVILRDTGARLSEVCLRTVADVVEDGAALRIPFGKTRNSIRTVPLSPDAQGALERVLEGKQPEDHLFPQYATGRGPDSASASLMKRMRGVVSERKKTVHSLRHRMKDRLRDTGCPADIQEEIMGHAAQNVARHYGGGYSLERKRERMEKVWSGFTKG